MDKADTTAKVQRQSLQLLPAVRNSGQEFCSSDITININCSSDTVLNSSQKTSERGIMDVVLDMGRSRTMSCPREFSKTARGKRLSLPSDYATIEVNRCRMVAWASDTGPEMPPPSYRSIIHLTIMDAPPSYTDATGRRVSFGLVAMEEAKQRQFFTRNISQGRSPSAGRFVIVVILIIVVIVTVILVMATTVHM